MRADLVRLIERKMPDLQEYDLIGFWLRILSRAPSLRPYHPRMEGRFQGKRPGFSALAGIPHRPLRAAPETRKIPIAGELRLPGYDTDAIFGLVGGINCGRPGDRKQEHARECARPMARDQGAGALS